MSQLIKVSTLPAILAGALVTCVLMTSCGDKAGPAKSEGSTKTAGTEAAASGPAISVTTVIARQRDMPVELEATGTVVPVTSVDVRPQVTSSIISVHVREGQFVKAGDLLFTLDSRTDEANVARLRAQMAKDQAALADAQRQLTRSRELLEQKFISQGAVDTNQSLVDSQAALVAADRAAIDAARVALAYGRVTAPSAGRVGAVVVYPGTSVQANQTTLVTITQLDPIDVSFNVPQRNLADVLAALKEGGAAVTAALPESRSTVSGKLLFVDNAVDAGFGHGQGQGAFRQCGQQAVARRIRQGNAERANAEGGGGRTAGSDHPERERHDRLCGRGRQSGSTPGAITCRRRR